MAKTNYVITISRQFGSGGRLIGKKLAEMLEIPFYDKELITMAAQQSGYSREVFEKADERATNSLLYTLSMNSYLLHGMTGMAELPLNDKVFLIQSEIIRKVASEGPCVIVGRCADYVLKDNPRHLNFYIYADLKSRVERATTVYGMEKDRDEMLKKLVEMQYERNDINFVRNKFRVRGDVVEIFPSNNGENAIRVEFFGDEIERISEINVLTGEIIGNYRHAVIMPASHYVTTAEKMALAMTAIEEEMEERVKYFKERDLLIEAQRIEQRTRYDLEMMREIGFCQGIENYSRHISGRAPGSAPFTLLDYFPEDYLMIIDESHVTIPQVRGMYNGDRARKETLIKYGFRLPSAADNRPLKFDEFEKRLSQVIFTSATPGEYEKEHSTVVAEQVIRPTGLVDPKIEVRPTEHQIDDLIGEITKVTDAGYRTLVTTLTKKMAEDLTDYLKEIGVKVTYMHSDIKTIERTQIIKDLRLGVYDVLVGINLLREGLDIPEVALVAILDADKEGFLRSEMSLIQTIGRAARNAEGRVIMYGDSITRSMDRAITETERRRSLQMDYNEKHGIVPKTINKEIRDIIEPMEAVEEKRAMPEADLRREIAELEILMLDAAEKLEFEKAAEYRDRIRRLEKGSED